jgi:hypothetical protein
LAPRPPARPIVAAIAPQIETMEQSKASRRRPTDLSAYEIALRAWSHAWEGNDKADRTLIDQSIREAKETLASDTSSVPALFAPAGTPPAIIDWLNKAAQQAFNAPDVRQRLEPGGGVLALGTPAALGAWVAADTERWARVIREAAIKLD